MTVTASPLAAVRRTTELRPAAESASTPTPPAAPVDPARRTLSAALNQGYQYLIGASFEDGARALRDSGSRGLAILDPAGASASQLRELRQRGVLPIAYNNAFQTQPGERLPPGVPTLGTDNQWGEQVPDFRHRAWQDRRIAEAVDAAKRGFGGVMLDNVPRAGTSREAAEYVARMAREARAASGNPNFGIILQNGEQLVRAHPYLAREGYVAALQKEDVSFRVNGAGTSTGSPVDGDERAALRSTLEAIHRQAPGLPLIAVDYPSSAAQARLARDRAADLGFNVAHVAIGDGTLARISRETRVVRPIPLAPSADQLDPGPPPRAPSGGVPMRPQLAPPR